MKEMNVIFRHDRLPAINKLLYKHKIIFQLYNINGRGREKRNEVPEVISSEAPYRTGMKFTPHFTDGIELEMIVLDFMVKLVFDEIIVTLSNGLASDGRIFVRMFLTHMILEQKLI
jgi:nitrogen regulatory protein PII